MTEIEQLKKELQKKISELSTCLENQHLLNERLKSSSAAMKDIKSRLKDVEAFVERTNEYIYQLQLENRKLKSSSDQWMKRAISLEFKILNVRNGKD
ncbi:hypothetical protein [Candidatus Methylobacter oryzae]|uniref:Uncharacterized protein n=1 Tax=Candidatus Methylobacter oryzae TaxID=2497749 RepID=A0ABY3CEA1_9GAMM|nr:hypothetical protein [Candidatus Methylobacter oryzae]TRX01416.1 hypothetical protein EKO24_003800 [Candidatus Methylobacter oryzae]